VAGNPDPYSGALQLSSSEDFSGLKKRDGKSVPFISIYSLRYECLENYV
jgi:hypothetical protein